jgi:capsule synthesis protein PGA_cap
VRKFATLSLVVILGLSGATWHESGASAQASVGAPTVTLAAVGDTDLGNTPQLPSDPGDYFSPIVSALAAPIVFGNLEGTMTTSTTSKCRHTSQHCYAFKVPPSYASIYRRAGFTVLNSANNHSYDFGEAGVLSTTAALRAVGIVQAGLPGQIGVVRDGSLKVAFVDFAPYYNTNNLLNLVTAAQLIQKAKGVANVVVVYMHAGAEGASADHVTKKTEYFEGETRGDPYAFAHAAINDGADLVIASGPHVLRGMEFYRGHLIDYSLGDFTNFDAFALDGDLDLSAILHVTLSDTGSLVSARFTSVVLRGRGQAFVDPTAAAARFVNQLSREDFGATAAIIAPSGSIHPSN